MNRFFRIETIKRLLGKEEIKKAETVIPEFKKEAEIFNDVAQSLKDKGFEPKEESKKEKADKNKPTYSGKIVIPAVKKGVSVKVPDQPIINGKYNVFFQVRHGRNPTKSGVNTIIVEAEAGGMGSSENTAAFGNADWVKKQLGTIHSTLAKKFGDNISLGKLGFGSFSGGYDAIGNILRTADDEFKKKIDSIIILDGIHHGKRGKPDRAAMKAWLDYAKEAKEDPSKQFVLAYTAVDPGTYASTSDSANYLMSNLGVESAEDSTKNFAGITPASIGSSGGFHAVQLYPRKSDKPGYGYTLKEMKSQHIDAAKAMPDLWRQYLYEDWNTVT